MIPKQRERLAIISAGAGRRARVLITGGSGTVGQSFIQQYEHEFEFFNISRNEEFQTTLEQRFPQVKSYLSDIQNLDELYKIFFEVQPDIVIHAAAQKHVNLAEQNPSKTVEINIIGSLNVAKASVAAKVPLVIGVSTDKACQPENIYGYSKKILEQMFMEHYSLTTRFVCVRFANVACSHGSVIPLWIDSAMRGERLKLTDSRMNRLMFTCEQATQLIRSAIHFAELSTEPFVLCRSMKSVSLLDLASLISDEFGNGQRVQVVGVRPGEQFNETLVSQSELAVSSIANEGKHIFLHSSEFGKQRLSQPLSSLTAQYMSASEMRSLYEDYVSNFSLSQSAVINPAGSCTSSSMRAVS